MTLEIHGKRFGRLLAVEKVGSVKKKVVWRFRCDCGSVVDLPATLVHRGHTQSCGCLRVEAAREAVAKDITGQRFGRLLATGRSGESVRGRIGWICVCDCGETVTRPSKNLLNGTATSCGCRKREAGIENVRAREVDLTGKQFGKLLVVGEAGRPKPGVKLWKCACECGGERISRHGDLQKGRVISCGCAEKGPHVTPLMPESARMACATHNANRRAQKRSAGGKFTAQQIDDLYAKQRGRCAGPGCGVKLSKSEIRRDHRIALANGGSNDISNIELLCHDCNSRKSAKDPIAWANENGRLI